MKKKKKVVTQRKNKTAVLKKWFYADVQSHTFLCSQTFWLPTFIYAQPGGNKESIPSRLKAP